MTSWLPDLVTYNSDWESYSVTLYNEYLRIYRNGTPITFNGKLVTAPRQPEFYGKSESFWHIIGGKDNIPDKDRCERIGWARAIIEHAKDEEVLILLEERGKRKTTILWLKNNDYAVILEERKKYYLLKTAYCVKPHKRKFFERLSEESEHKVE